MGWGDSPRADNWLDDMAFIGACLKERALCPEAIYCSDLQRSRGTAEYFAKELGVTEVRATVQLNEINYGSLYQKPKKWVAEQYPQHKQDPDFVYPQGESFRQMQERAANFVQQLSHSHAAETVLCVAHAGVVRALVSHFLELDYCAQLKRKICHRYIGLLSFEGERCVAYDEWGQASGFITDGVLALPYSSKIA